MDLPFAAPLTVRAPARRVVPEPPRRGEDGGPPCGVCAGHLAPVWSDEHFTLHPPVGTSLPGTLWLASRVHVDSFSDLPPGAAAALGPVLARVERAMLGALPDVARVHVYRWGDGGAHFHLWLMPRPLGMLEASGAGLPIWEDVLPNVPDDDARAAAERVGAALGGGPHAAGSPARVKDEESPIGAVTPRPAGDRRR